MALNILAPVNSFVQFDETVQEHCLWPGREQMCLPVYDAEDIYFQFVIEADTPEEADTLCGLTNNVQVGIVHECSDADFALEFSEIPERNRISPTQVLFNWQHGIPGFIGVIDIGECFRLRIKIEENEWCSSCFSRIANDCFTSVIEYGNDENAFGFYYCASNDSISGGGELSCEPYFFPFINKTTLTIPYTASLLAAYGDVPNVQVWMYIDGILQVVTVQITMDGAPPSAIEIDLGGTSTGYVVIR